MKKLALLGVMAVSLVTTPSWTSAVFDDVPVASELQEAVQFLEIRGGLQPRPKLNGEQPITRVAFLKMLLAPIRLSEADQKAADQVVLGFTDIDVRQWYTPILKKAVFLGLIENQETAFLPDSWMMRGEGLAIAMKAYGLPAPYLGNTIEQQYGDIHRESAYKSVVARAKKYQLLQERQERLFGVFYPLTKAETALVTFRLQKLQGDFARPAGDLPVVQVEIGTGGTLDGVDTELFNTVLEQVEQGYLFPEELDYEKLSYGAIKGMVEAIGDPYSQYLPPVDAESFEVSLEGQVEGIGTYVESHDLGLRIQSVIPGTPAERAGLKAGDVIFSVNGESLEGLTSQEAASKIRGPKGSEAKIEVIRDGVVLSFSVVRDAFEVTSITKEIKDGLYILKIADFRDTTGAEFATYVEDIQKVRPKMLVIDLRDNPGGYLSSSIQILRHFFPKGTNLLSVDYGEDEGILDYPSSDDGDLMSIPVVILVNQNSASASEVLAGTMQDYGRATLVGETTYGKGTVQGLLEFTDESTLKLTIARWLTGEGRWVNEWTDAEGKTHKGLLPDVIVERGSLEEVQEELIQKDKELDTEYDQKVYETIKKINP